MDGFKIVAIRVYNESGVIARRIIRTWPGRSIVFAARSNCSGIKAIDSSWLGSGQRDVDADGFASTAPIHSAGLSVPNAAASSKLASLP